MNLRHQETFCIVLLISTISITLGHDFQFASEKEEEEVQPMLAEPLDVVSKAKPIKSIYSKEKAHCHETQNRIILSLVLRSHSWDEIVEKKRQKAVNKLSKFFLIPKENFVIDDVNRLEVHQMTTNAIRRGRNNLNSSKRKLGRIGFLIGCDKTIFPSEKLIANTIAQQMKERALDDISGLDFGWWSIWTEHPEEGNHQQQQQHHYHQHRQQQQRQKQLLQGRRVRRQTSEDDYDNDDDDYDYNYDDEDEAEPTEIPQHAHRHHHGDGSQPQPGEHSTTNVSPAKSIGTVVVGAGLNQHGSHREMEPDENNLIAAARVLDRTTVTATADAHGSRKTGPGQKVHMTQTEPNDQFDFTQADIRESVSQLESTITKTIRNNEQLKQEEESLLARKSSKHKPIDIERIVETELMLPDIEQLKGRDVFKDDYVIEDMVTPVVSTKKVPVSTVIKKPHSSSGTAAITATISPTSKSPVQSSSRMGSSRSTIKTIPNGGSSTTLATRKATTPEMTTRQTTATFTTEPTNDANLSNQRWTSSTKEEFTSDTSITSGNTVPNKQQHSPAVTNPTTTQITTTRSTPATTTKRAEIFTFPTSSSSRSDEAEAEAATINHHVTIDVTITTPLLPLNPTTTTVTSTTSSVTTSRVTTLVPRGAVEQREDKETLVSTTATNIRSTNENKSDYKAVVPATAASLPLDGKVKTDDKEDESAESLLPTSLGTPLTEAEQTGSTAAASTISITSAGLIPTETGPLEQVRIATTTSRTTGDFQLGEDHYSEEVPAEESTEDEYEDTVIITELPNSVAPVVSIATSTAIPPTIRTVTSTETVMAEREPDSTTIEPIGSSTTISPTSSSSFSATITTTQAPLPSPTATTTTETETASTTPLELITVPRVVFVDATTTPAITTTTSTTTSTATPTDSDSTTTSFRSKATTPTTVSKAPAPIGGKRESNEDTFEENYDDEYDDELEEELPTSPATPVGRLPGIVDPVAAVSTESTTPDATTIPSPTTVPSTSPSTTIPVTTTTTTNSISTEASSTASTTVASTASTTQPSTTELDEPTNLHPIIRNRIPKQAIIAGKVFSLPVPLETFYDAEDGNNLRLELFDSHGNQLKNNSWVQFNVETREIYGLPLEKDVSKWHYILQAVDSGEQSVNETVDVSVQQHKSHRSVNHEISLALRLQRKFARNVDWQIEVIRGIAKVLGDVSLTNIVVREVRNSIQDPNLATFVYTNETLPKDRCPEEKLEELVVQLTEKALNDALNPDILVKSVQGQQIGQCLKSLIPKVKPTQTIATKNFAPTTRNQVDRVNATVGHLLVYKVPIDTFYDPEDGTDLKLKLLTTIRSPLDQYHWLQFDSKNHEFFGIPRNSDIGQKEYLLMAEDREGLTATDALVVVVHQAHPKRDHSVLFELTLDTTHEQFSTAQTQRRFIERLAQVFGDANTNYIQIRNIRTIMHSGQVQVAFYNTTLYRQHQRCPNEEIESMRNILMYPDGTIRAKVREILGQEFSLQNVSLIPVGTCQGYDTPIHVTNEPEKTLPPPIAKDDYLLTFVLPAVIILTMLLIAFIIACILYRRRLTGKMELGTDEERKSFRSKGIPVIFQDELDEKPEIGNKSPVILKDEKPPLLPPSYSSTNNDGENDDLDEYVPPPAVVVGGRESRGKSPVTPSYRRPPPYVSP
ncbi:uncharacterized protein LOC131434652 isoform X2 [Malaya genurostris]|uniref:uncharacterized protein LOC131434652 isoform X2 n=1 Tax=Malaya genurostris TaxID=325434 RepID=UPI0026F3EC76|nr:uncharacterized protein LOC131434652 isoform X2 [Malaya genurostris]